MPGWCKEWGTPQSCMTTDFEPFSGRPALVNCKVDNVVDNAVDNVVDNAVWPRQQLTANHEEFQAS